MEVAYDKRLYSSRNYDLFAILADVRNGRGFADVMTGYGFNPISPPRGVPVDCCPEYSREVERWDGDGHSHSWLILEEILSFDWNQKARKVGWVDPIEWTHWRDYGSPKKWSGCVDGGNVRHVSTEDFETAWQQLRELRGWPKQCYASAHLNTYGTEELQAFIELVGGGSPYTRVEWDINYYEHAREFWSSTIPRLLHIRKSGEVRCVFFFDN